MHGRLRHVTSDPAATSYDDEYDDLYSPRDMVARTKKTSKYVLYSMKK